MPKSQIIKDIIEDQEPIDKSMARLLILAKDIKNKHLEKWAEKELSGYDSLDEVPEYRRIKSDLIKYSGINGGFQVRGVPMPISFLGDDLYEKVCNITELNGLNTILSFSMSENCPTRDLSLYAGVVANKTNGGVTCISIEQQIPQAVYKSIVATVKIKLITAFCELEDSYGNLDKLMIDVSKKRSNKIEANNIALNKKVLGLEVSGQQKEPWYSKIAWNIIIPILTATIAAVASAWLVHYFGV